MASAKMADSPTGSQSENVSQRENIDEREFEKEMAKMSRFGFFIPGWMKVLFNRNSDEEFHAEWLTIDEYKQKAEESMQEAWSVINLTNWSLEKRGVTRGDVVESTHTDRFGKVYRFTGIVECPSKFLFEEFKENIVKLPQWNPTILKSELVKQISDGIDLSYQITAGGGRGIIAPRDFVILRRCAGLTREGAVTTGEPYCYISSGVSVNVPGYPPGPNVVRGHNKVGCWVMKPKTVQLPGGKIEQHTVFQWLMCCDLKGKIPQFLLDAAFATVMLDYIVHVRKFTADAKSKGLF